MARSPLPDAVWEEDFSPQLWAPEKKAAYRVSEIEHPSCPHCGQKMEKWAVPAASTWEGVFHYVCFNDECPYFVRGWKWIKEQYNAHASYRHCIDPATGHSRPLPVWSETALKNDIIRDEGDSGKGAGKEDK